uniref:Uncharacterized protein n=1 Tax=Lepeophtheirus salmonis TaxID=72036 RepID=A0A0K2VI72_LEPSM
MTCRSHLSITKELLYSYCSIEDYYSVVRLNHINRGHFQW